MVIPESKKWFPVEAVNTLRAGHWTLFLAKMFGKKVETADGDMELVFYRWRGVTYLTGATQIIKL